MSAETSASADALNRLWATLTASLILAAARSGARDQMIGLMRSQLDRFPPTDIPADELELAIDGSARRMVDAFIDAGEAILARTQ